MEMKSFNSEPLLSALRASGSWKPFRLPHPCPFLSLAEQCAEVPCETQQSCLLFGWVIISFFFFFFILFCAWSGRSITSAVTKATSWNVAALSYPQSHVLVGHDFKCMQLKSVSFFCLPYPSSIILHLYFIFSKKKKDKIYKHHL